MGNIYSMTGYGSAKGELEGQSVTVELRSVNNRYLDCAVRLPRTLLFAEDKVKEAVSSLVKRGKVDVFVTVQAAHESGTEVAADEALARGYYEAVVRIAKELDLEIGLNAAAVARFPDVLTLERKELDKEAAGETLYSLTVQAVKEFNAMRAREGERLREDMLSKLTVIEGLVSVVEARSPETVREYRQRLEMRLRELLEDRNVDEQRLITETAIFADKTAVDEETVRLRSHIAQFRAMLAEGSPIGRKMDFLIQEFNRESNTIGSKCSDAQLAAVVVELKSEIEKIREQLQNVEREMSIELLNIGLGNMVSVSRIIAIVSPESAPIKRIIQDVRERGDLIDATCGRRTRSVVIMDSGHVVLSPLQPETLNARLEQRNESAEEEIDE